MPRLIVIAVLMLLCSACSRIELAYRNADSLLERYARRTVQISDPQREHWQPVVQTTLRRHSERELPLVVAYLDLAGRIIRQPDGSVGAACLVDGALFLYQRHARLAVDLAVPLFAELDAAQVRHLAEYTTQRRQDALKRYLDPDPQRRKMARQERMRERVEKWTGKLNGSQRQQINDAVERIPDLSAQWLAYRARKTDTLLYMLETGANAQAIRLYLEGWWMERAGTSDETLQRWRMARREFIQLLENLAATLTDTQRRSLGKRLVDLRESLTSFLPGAPQSVKLTNVPACASLTS